MSNQYGLGFPLQFENGELIEPSLNQSIEASIKNVFAYPPLHRKYDPTFFGDIYELLSQPADSISFSELRQRISRAIVLHEKRVTIKEIHITNDQGFVTVRIDLKVNETQQDLSINF